MNILTFWLRISIAALFILLGLISISEKEINSGVASIALAVVALLPLLRLLYLYQKPEPASFLKNSFFPRKTVARLRGFMGFLLSFSAIGLLDKNDESGWGISAIGLFLFSPLGDIVFTYDATPPDPITGHPQWNKKMTRLMITRIVGVIFLCYAVEFHKEHKYSYLYFSLFLGVTLVLIRQIRLLFSRKSAAI
jgi:hypothetical protein